MDIERVVCIHNGVLFNHKEEHNYVIWRKMNGTGDHHFEQDKPNSKSQIQYHTCNLELK
jgi:hypothetical protein